MHSVESASAQVAVDWSSCDGDESEVFLSEEEPAEVSRGHGRSSTLSFSSSSSSSSLGPGWRGKSDEGGDLKEPAGGTQGDLLFAKKCIELQGFIRPLLELLNGLKNGRFEKGLSSFQQSVAMDRIQRIVGVLQKPHIGVRYLPTLLQVEIMLKHWFPQVSPQLAQTSAPTLHFGQNPSCSSMLSHRHKDQLHIPVKKRRLSWSDSDSTCKPTTGLCKRPHLTTNVKVIHKSPQSTPDGDPSERSALHCSEPSLTWVHVAPIPSPPKTSHRTAEEGSSHILLTHPPLACRTNPATQDNAVSSTTFISESTASRNQTEVTDRTTGHKETPPITTQVSSSIQS